MRLWTRARSRAAPARPKRRRVRVPQPYERTFSATVRRAQAPKSSHATILAEGRRPWEFPSPIAEVSTCERGDGGAIDNGPVPGRLFCALAPLARPAAPTSPPVGFKTAPSLIDEHMYRLSRHRHGRMSESAPGPRRYRAAIILRAQCGRRKSEVGKWSIYRDFGTSGICGRARAPSSFSSRMWLWASGWPAPFERMMLVESSVAAGRFWHIPTWRPLLANPELHAPHRNICHSNTAIRRQGLSEAPPTGAGAVYSAGVGSTPKMSLQLLKLPSCRASQ